MSTPTPLEAKELFHVGPVVITQPVVTAFVLVLLLGAISAVITRGMGPRPTRAQVVLEALVSIVSVQLREVLGRDPAPFLPLLGTLFLFISVSNLAGLFPGVTPPTANLETVAALALIVFFSTHAYGIRSRGIREYLVSYTKPSVFFLPLNILSELTRTFSLMVRLFGNIMSHELVIGIIVSLVGLFVPIPFMALSILIGIIQAYIFTVLATVYIGAAVGAIEKG